MNQGLDCRILGGLEVRVHGQPVALGGAKQQMVLARLLLDPNRVVSTDRLIDWVWGEDAPDSTASTLQVYVSNLRRALSLAAPASDPAPIVTRRPGYLIEVAPAELDATRFEERVTAAQSSAHFGDSAECVVLLRSALAEWHGDPLEGLPLGIGAVSMMTRLHVLRDGAIEMLIEAEFELGHHREILVELEEWLARQPLNERLRELQMLALYRTGRQADALAAYQQTRDLFLNELGLDPSPRLRELESRILAHDPSLQPSNNVVARDFSGMPMPNESATVIRASVVRSPARLRIDGRDIVLDRAAVSVGRSTDRTIVLEDPGVSRNHAEIRHEGEEWRIVDVGSANGITVNGAQVTSCVLSDGDVIRLGDQELTFRAGV